LKTQKIVVGSVEIGGGAPIALIAGPCVVESEALAFETARAIKAVAERIGVAFVYKSSYKKANRTSVGSFTGLGDEAALAILAAVKAELGVPILTDVHSPAEAALAAKTADVLQIPAFLCRQTDLLQAAGETGKAVNVKKGQFMAPEDMRHAIDKVRATGNERVLVTERGASFGYHNLVVDYRSLPTMRAFGKPTVMDATHAVQIPSKGGASGGAPDHIAPLAFAACAVGVDALFVETHPDPPNALSDAGSQLPLDELDSLLAHAKKIDEISKERERSL
jgi:2-dehydro-3-deoxyphosphooctonate aldolase (KDO 8-P synthase)